MRRDFLSDFKFLETEMGRGRRVAIISVVFLCLTIIIPFVYYVAARPYPLIIKGDYVEGNPEGQESDTDSVTGMLVLCIVILMVCKVL